MACELCQHCDTAVEPGDATVVDGYSYHRQCRKCYVCGETDLRNAETFRGVIFCTGCSQRIFQGCSTARQAKSLKTKRRSPRHRAKRRLRNKDTMQDLTRSGREPESSSSGFSNDTRKTKVHKKEIRRKDIKKKSAEIGTTTNVTQEILKLAKHPREVSHIVPTLAKPRKKRKAHKIKNNKNECSDLRIAELGASVEIAHMTLRKPSEVPVVIRSETHVKQTKSLSLSSLNQKSNEFGDSKDKWADSPFSSSEDLEKVHWTQRRFQSILKIPFKCFKRSILDRSSLVSVLMSSESYANCPISFRALLNKEIAEHHRRGLKKLYSSINRRKKPCKLGWTYLTPNVEEKRHGKRCKHFVTSHSYRCMRDHVMRLAGPTQSELAVQRKHIMDALSPTFMKKVINYNDNYATILSAQVGKHH